MGYISEIFGMRGLFKCRNTHRVTSTRHTRVDSKYALAVCRIMTADRVNKVEKTIVKENSERVLWSRDGRSVRLS
jgi:hypothetical protein